MIADISEERCQARVDELAKAGCKASYGVVDVTSRKSLEALLNKALEVKGRVDILVNCAGVNAGTSFLDASEADWDRIMAINLKAVFLACQVFGKQMVEAGGGSILNIGSVTSIRPLSRVFGYAASKAGVVNLTQNIAQDFGTKGVRVNAICPGFFPAEQNRKLLDQERVDNIMRHTPMKRYGEPEELIGRRPLAAVAQGRQLHHRFDRQCRRRIYRGLVLRAKSDRKSAISGQPKATGRLVGFWQIVDR